MEFIINANTLEDADKKLTAVLTKIWNEYVDAFQMKTSESQKKEIARKAIERGVVPFNVSKELEAVCLALECASNQRKTRIVTSFKPKSNLLEDAVIHQKD